MAILFEIGFAKLERQRYWGNWEIRVKCVYTEMFILYDSSSLYDDIMLNQL